MDTVNTYTYDWSEDSFDGLPYVENVPHGTYTVEISYGDCSKKIEFTTPIGGIERIEINSQTAGCTGIGNIILEKVTGGQGPYTIDITGEQFDSSLQIMGLSSGIYPFLITDIKGCQFRDTVEIISDVSLPVVTPKVQVDCETSIYSLDFSEIEGGTPPYRLIFEGDIASDFLIEDLPPGTYKYEILDSSGCHSGIDEIYLFEIPEVMIANRDTFIVPGDPIFLSAFVDTSILRAFGWISEHTNICRYCLDTIYENAEEGTYFFTYDFKLFDGSPCEKTHRFRVRYLQAKIFIPNAFSPNGDNVNDVFEIYAPNHEVVNLQIYNRWGAQIFSSAGPDFQWNGQIGSKKAEPGVYVYQVLLKDKNGNAQQKTGSITLIR